MDDPIAALRQLIAIADPAERAQAIGKALSAMPTVQAELSEARQAAVVEMKQAGMSFAGIGTVLGVSRGRAQQIYEGRTTGKRKGEEPA